MSAPRPDVTPPQPWTFPVPTEHVLGNGVRVLAHDLPGPVRALAARRRAHRAVGRAGRQGGHRRDDRPAARRGHRRPRVRGVRRADGAPRDGARRRRLRRRPARRRRRAAAAPRHRGGAGHRGAGRPGLPRGRGAPHPAQPARRDRAGAGLLGRTAPPASWPARCGTPTTGPAGRPPAPPRPSAALTRDDLVEFHATAVGPQGATVVVAGDLTGVDVVGVLEGTLGTWSAPRHRPAGPAGRPGARAGCRPRRRRRPPRLGADRDRRRPPGPRPVHARRAGRPTRCCPSCSAARPAPASTPCCARRRATPTASAARSGRGWPGGSFVTSGSVRSEVTGEARRDPARHPRRRPRRVHRRRGALGRRLRRQDRAGPLRHGGCRRRRDRGPGPGGAAARLHDPQPARGRPRSAATTSTRPTAGSRRGSGAWSSSATPAAWCRPSTGRVGEPVSTVAL